MPIKAMKITMLAYVEARQNGVAEGQVILNDSENDDVIDFEVEDNEPDDVWGPIISRIAEEVGFNGSPDYCDGGVITDHHINVGVALLEITVTPTTTTGKQD